MEGRREERWRGGKMEGRREERWRGGEMEGRREERWRGDGEERWRGGGRRDGGETGGEMEGRRGGEMEGRWEERWRGDGRRDGGEKEEGGERRGGTKGKRGEEREEGGKGEEKKILSLAPGSRDPPKTGRDSQHTKLREILRMGPSPYMVVHVFLILGNKTLTSMSIFPRGKKVFVCSLEAAEGRKGVCEGQL